MLTNKPIVNKFYLYKQSLVKIKKIQKSSGVIVVKNVHSDDEEAIPSTGAEILLTRLYTIGELAKIIGKRSDTLRKYERQGLMPKPSCVFESDTRYKNWRFYNESDVYDVISFFSGRTPGRPASVTKSSIKRNIASLKEKVNKI